MFEMRIHGLEPEDPNDIFAGDPVMAALRRQMAKQRAAEQN